MIALRRLELRLRVAVQHLSLEAVMLLSMVRALLRAVVVSLETVLVFRPNTLSVMKLVDASDRGANVDI